VKLSEKITKNPKINLGSSQFWLNDRISKQLEDIDITTLLGMAEIQRAISNFVQIVSSENIPVKFGGKESFTDRNSIQIASINDKNFDSTCGLALHEASHIKFSLPPDEILRLIELYQTGMMNLNEMLFNDYGIVTNECIHQSNIKLLVNWIDDRRVDSLIRKEFPGYINYYESMYNFYFRSDEINKVIASNYYRCANNIDDYFFRIINFLSPETDLDALPGLREIWNLIDLDNISRLSSMDVIYLAAKVYDIILSHVSNKNSSNQNFNQKKYNSNNTVDDKIAHQAIKKFSKQKNFINGKVNKDVVSDLDLIQLDLLEKMKVKFIPITAKTIYNELLKIDVLMVEHLPTQLFDIISSNQNDANSRQIKNDFKYNPILRKIFRYGNDVSKSEIPKLYNAVEQGIKLGKQLGAKLQIYSEERVLKTTRQTNGKIDKRILYTADFADSENIFYTLRTMQYNKSHVHISIDASGSMNANDKFFNAIQTAATIVSAVDMIKNIDVVVTIRTSVFITMDENKKYAESTTIDGTIFKQWPTVVVIYDSRHDKLSKLLKVWPWLDATGTTPEALTYEAERKLMPNNVYETDSYFITLTDGEQSSSGIGKKSNGKIVEYSYRIDNYIGNSSELIKAEKYTQHQISKMKRDGIFPLAFFISDNNENDINLFNSFISKEIQIAMDYKKNLIGAAYDFLKLSKNNFPTEILSFKRCYGQNGVVINTNNLMQLAKIMNNLFLKNNPF